MKTLGTFLITAFIVIKLSAQQNEFEIYSNHLIYPEETMKKLRTIADDLNLKFLSCETDPVHFASEHALATLITIEKSNIADALKDMNAKLPMEEFRLKYPEANYQEHVLVYRSLYENYGGQKTVYFKQFNLSGTPVVVSKYDPSFKTKNVTGLWVYPDNNPAEKDVLNVFYFPEKFQTPKLPLNYARMIAYADCMIDTTSAKLLEESEKGRPQLPQNWRNLSRKKQEELLHKLRSARVYGMCSMDSSPRYHAMHIALVAAETQRWEVFLKAHLDILNDNFTRMSDGSYAWAERKTYIKELESLNINLTDLLMGICLLHDNPAEHHYYANISRIGRALSEAFAREELENTILAAIRDSELDLINRIRMYFLYKQFVVHLPESERDAQYQKLEAAIEYLPYNLKETHKRW